MEKNRLAQLQKEFCDILCANVRREGLEPFYEWLVKTDFMYAPYSDKGIGAYEGGLVEHSINTYRYLHTANMQLKKPYPEETIAFVGLLHDVCLANTFKASTRNKKNEKGGWETVPCFTRDDTQFLVGHGEKSVIILQMFFSSQNVKDENGKNTLKSGLSADEILAIRWHEGSNDVAVKHGEASLSDIYGASKLAYLLQRAVQDADVLRSLM